MRIFRRFGAGGYLSAVLFSRSMIGGKDGGVSWGRRLLGVGLLSVTALAIAQADKAATPAPGADRASADGGNQAQLITYPPPWVVLTSPTAGAYPAPTNLAFAADAGPGDDAPRITKVEFYANGALKGSDTTKPYTYAWNNVAAGVYYVYAKAYDNAGGFAYTPTTTVAVGPQAPKVVLTSPKNETLINGPADYTLSANASDLDGTIEKVEFFDGATLIATDDTAPYSLVWSGIRPGSYSITAKATDDEGLVATSAVATFTVNAPPTVSISAPKPGSVVAAPANVLVQAAAEDADDGVAIVEFYIDGQWRATDTAAPFALQISNLPSGTYTLAAKVYDNRGGASWSENVTLISNNAPQVQLTSPASNISVALPKTITLAAAANDSDGSIDKVEFYNGATLLGTVATPPYQLAWTVPGAGDYSLSARAYDDRGTDTTSSPALVRAGVEGFALIQSANRTSLAGELPAHDPTVGTLQGRAGVSGGAATYEIPIVVPPGRRGMEPSLAMVYNSRAGNGIGGMGWSLSGLSSIHRCPATLAQDGLIRAVQLSGVDKLCLDGQRLVPTSGAYGQAGTTYATELDSFVRVTQLGGSLASSQSYFKVERKSGEIAYYGGTSSAASESRVVPGGAALPLSWLISRVEDRVGNNMSYAYAGYGAGETLLSSVHYTGFNGSVGNRRVTFVYESRPVGAGANDQSSTYVAGGVTRQTQRLKAVVTYVGAEPVRQLLLNYGSGVSAGTGRSLLQAASDCAHDGAQWICKSPTTFAWQHGAPTYALRAPTLGFDSASVTSNLRPAGDFDGDGAAEVIVDRRDRSTNALRFYLVSLTPERTTRWVLPIPKEYGGFYAQTLQDFNQDGRVDLVGRDASDNVIVRSWSGMGGDFSTAFTQGWNTGLNVPVFGAEISHIGDMDGDGRADFVISRKNPAGGDSCRWKAVVHRNTPSISSPQAAPSFPAVAEHCLAGQRLGSNLWAQEKVEKVRDFDGDGLPDLWIQSPQGLFGGSYLSRIAFGQRSGGYALAPVPLSALITSKDPIQAQEQHAGLFAVWLDVNGDGLDDMVYARSDNGAGRWTLRLNQGGMLGPRYRFTSNAGIARCITRSRNATQCAQVWTPWLAARIRAADIDGDGRSEILVPTRFAANICLKLRPNPGRCPHRDGTSPDCNERFACPEDPATGNPVLGGTGYFDFVGSSGSPTIRDDERYRVQSAYYDGYTDVSSYFMTALRFAETSANTMELRETQTDLMLGAGFENEDLFADGYADLLTNVEPAPRDETAYGVPYAYGNGAQIPAHVAPRTLPGGIALMTRKALINESLGPGGVRNPDGVTPRTQDVLAMVTNGLGVQTLWTHYPLASKAERGAGGLPLYSVPLDLASRYIDEQHIYFNSSMPVVSEMIQSDGVGDYRSWRYGYAEAMYNNQGRGFQGFRTITEEDLDGGLRTTTSFHQKFPLTSQPQSVVVNPLARPGVSGAIKLELYTWRCNRADRTDATACAAAAAAGRVVFPYLDTKETWSFDAVAAADPAGGEPPALGLVQEVNADDTSCSGRYATASGFDALGNLTARTVHTHDLDSGGDGYRAFLRDQCQRELASFAPDTNTWWLDRLSQRTVSSSISWNAAQHALPSGVANPVQSVTMQYTWNADRTPASETVQPGVSGQQRVTTYTYPRSANYGLPEAVAVAASGDPNGSRATATAYNADGYFPGAVSNALGHAATTSIRLRDGQPAATTDPNGRRVLMQYDPFGTVLRTQYRGRTDAEMLAPDKATAVTRCARAGCWTPTEAYQVTEVQDGSPTTIARFDQLGRPRVKGQRQMDGVWSYVATDYNRRGQVARQSEPIRSGDTSWLWTQFTGYDLVGRLTRKVAPKQADDGRGDLVTTYAYRGRETAIQVCGTAGGECLNMSRTTDSLGRFVETVDANDGRTRFWHGALGHTIAIEDAQGAVTRASYNALGQRLALADPNQGRWSFVFNALGELLSQTDARGIVTTFAYDKLGRPTSRAASVDVTGDAAADAVVDSWRYDPSNGLGQEAISQRTTNGAVERTTATSYDALGRPIQRDITQATTGAATKAYRQRQKYDDYYGRPIGQEYPNGEAVEVVYSAYGHAISERDPLTGTVYRVLGGVNARGQPALETFGDTLQTRSRYAPATGQVKELLQESNGSPVRRLGYDYDVYGNVIRQSLNGGQTEEHYAYDALQRLTQATRTGAAAGSVSYGYDAVGNFRYKSDFSAAAIDAYRYAGGSCGGGPNAVKSVQMPGGETRAYCYDANGNLTGDNAGLALKYDHMNLPFVAQRGGRRDEFRYGPDGQRTRSSGSDGARVYLAGYEHRLDTGETKVYIGDYAVVTRSGATRTVEYLLKDRLGSVDAVANAAGAVTETRGYDAFGKPRSGTWADLSPPRLPNGTATPKGFTQHEHLSQVELIHMNGRAFDYNLGRFTGVDPFIQSPLNSQSLNPYSYIMNNPLSGTDPTGYQACTTGTHIKSDSGMNCEGLGVSGGKADENTVAHMNGRPVPTKTGSNGAAPGQTTDGGRRDQAAATSAKGSNANGADGGGIGGVSEQHNQTYSAKLGGIGVVPGYPESGKNDWRAANDVVFTDAVNSYNEKHKLKEADPGFWTPQRLKAQAMVESGGSKAAFLSDPLQVNVRGDWDPRKTSLGLKLGQVMTPEISAGAALEWMRYKGYTHDRAGREVQYRGNFEALRRYNGNVRIYPNHPGVEHRDWYGREILRLEGGM